jgi:hypothetical protein
VDVQERSRGVALGQKRRRKLMNPTLLQQPFFQVTLPIVIAMVATVWALISTNNRRLDDIRGDLKGVSQRLDRIDETLKTYGQKIAVLEDRS